MRCYLGVIFAIGCSAPAPKVQAPPVKPPVVPDLANAMPEVLPAELHGGYLAFSPDGTRVARGFTRRIELWTLATSARTNIDVDETMLGLAFDPTGEHLITASIDGRIRTIDPANGRVVRELDTGKRDVRFWALGPTRALAAPGVESWNLTTGKAEGNLADKVVPIDAVLAGDGTAAVLHPDGVAVFPRGAAPVMIAIASVEEYSRLAISATGKRVAVADKQRVRIYDVATRALVRELPESARGFAFTADGARIAFARDDMLRLHDVATGAELAHVPFAGNVAPWAGTTTIALAPAGDRFVVADPPVVVDAKLQSIHWLAAPIADDGVSIAFDPQGDRLVVGGTGKVHVWNLATGKPRSLAVHLKSAQVHVAVGADGTVVVGESGQLTLWRRDAETSYKRLSTSSIAAVAAAGDTFVVADQRYPIVIIVADVASGTQRRLPINLATEFGHLLALSHDGKQLVVDEDKSVGLWDLEHGTVRHLPGPHELGGAAFAGDALVLGGGPLVRFVDARGVRDVRAHDGQIVSVAASRDGAVAVTGADDGTLALWDVAAGTARWRVETREELHGVALAPDSSRVAMVSNTGTVELFDASDGALLATLRTWNDQWLVIAADGRVDGTADVADYLHWTVDEHPVPNAWTQRHVDGLLPRALAAKSHKPDRADPPKPVPFTCAPTTADLVDAHVLSDRRTIQICVDHPGACWTTDVVTRAVAPLAGDAGLILDGLPDQSHRPIKDPMPHDASGYHVCAPDGSCRDIAVALDPKLHPTTVLDGPWFAVAQSRVRAGSDDETGVTPTQQPFIDVQVFATATGKRVSAFKTRSGMIQIAGSALLVGEWYGDWSFHTRLYDLATGRDLGPIGGTSPLNTTPALSAAPTMGDVWAFTARTLLDNEQEAVLQNVRTGRIEHRYKHVVESRSLVLSTSAGPVVVGAGGKTVLLRPDGATTLIATSPRACR
jgi:WD40 repeat protein